MANTRKAVDKVLSYKYDPTTTTTMGAKQASATPGKREDPMKDWYTPFKLFSMVVVLLMAAAMAYGCVMALIYWSGIGV